MGNYMRKIQPQKHAEIVRLYATMNSRDLGKKYGVSHQAILNIVNDFGKKRAHGKRVKGGPRK